MISLAFCQRVPWSLQVQAHSRRETIILKWTSNSEMPRPGTGTGGNKGFLHYNLAVLSHLVALFLNLLVSAISQDDEYPEDV